MKKVAIAFALLTLTSCAEPEKPVADSGEAIRAYIQQKIMSCWNPAKSNAGDVRTVHLQVAFKTDGGLHRVTPLDKGLYKKDAVFKAKADEAIKAVKACTPVKGLDEETFEHWAIVQMNFD